MRCMGKEAGLRIGFWEGIMVLGERGVRRRVSGMGGVRMGAARRMRMEILNREEGIF